MRSLGGVWDVGVFWIALEYKLPAVTKPTKQHTQRGFFCLEAN